LLKRNKKTHDLVLLDPDLYLKENYDLEEVVIQDYDMTINLKFNKIFKWSDKVMIMAGSLVAACI